MASITAEEAAKELLRRRQARDSLLSFIEYTHPRWKTWDHHIKICHYLEQLEAQVVCPYCGYVIDKLGIFASPRSGKTEIALRRYIPWAMGRDPGSHTIAAMANGSLASDTGGEVRDIVDSPEYKKVFPDIYLQESAKAANRWVICKQGSSERGVYYTAGVDSSFPGRGAHRLVLDDPHKSAQEADSERMRDLVGRFYFGDAVMRLQSPSKQLLINTRRHEDDIAGRLLPPTEEWQNTDDPQFFCCPSLGGAASGNWHVLRIRAIENEGSDNEYATRTMRMKDNEDAVEHMKGLRSLYLSKGETRHWYSEFQQEPRAEEGTYCRREWYENRYETLPKGLNIYIACDYAVSAKEGNKNPDFTEFGVFGVDKERQVYVIDWWYGRVEADAWVDALLLLAQKWGPSCVFGEKGQINKSVGPFLRRAKKQRRIYFRTEDLARSVDKAAFGRPFQGMSASGAIHLPKSTLFPTDCPQGPNLVQRVADQWTGFLSGAKHDDAFDVAALMCAALDKAHPGVLVSRPRSEKRKDRWQTQKSPDNWKTL